MATVLSFNSRCPLHRRKCRCSLAFRQRASLAGYDHFSTSSETGTRSKTSSQRPRNVVQRTTQRPTSEGSKTPLVRAPGGAGWRQDHEQAHIYFLTFAAADVRNYVPSEFWQTTVVRASQEDRTVRYAIAAVSKAHQAYVSNATSDYHALVSYNIALAKLRGHLQQGHSVETVLVCCILVFTAERMLGHAETSYQHLRAACAMLNTQLRNDGSNAGRLNAFKHVLVRLDVEASMLFRHNTLLSDLAPITIEPPTTAATWLGRPKFSTLQEAAYHLDTIVHPIWRLLPLSFVYRDHQEIPPEILATKTQLRQRLRSWNLAFDQLEWEIFLDTMAPSSTEPDAFKNASDRLGLLTLRAHSLINEWTLAGTLNDKVVPRPFDSNPMKLLRVGEEGLRLRQSMETMREQHIPRSFSIHIGLPETLILLGHRTSYPAIRAQSMSLVRAFRNLEGRKEVWRWIPIDWMDLKEKDSLFLAAPGH